MNPTECRTCSRCGAGLGSNSADQFCPACMMSAALATSGEETTLFRNGQSGSPPQPTDFPFEFGGYRLLGVLGSGGMGTVYDAEQKASGRRVALKMLGHQLDSPDMRQRFLREGRLAAGVSHPNSLYIFGAEEIERTPVITMEIAGGGTLKDKLNKRSPLPVAQAVDAILDVIAGLEAAYAGGVLHRDIKPSNCFVSPDGTVKIGDFGLSVSTLAKDDSYATATGVIMGTPAYAPPEQLRGDDLDVRADIYSVGATLFTLLTGRAPFEGDNAVQVVANAVNQKPKPLSELRDDIPPGLERLVARCLAKEPGGRFSDYTVLRNALLPFSSKQPEPASLKVRASAGWIDYLIAFLPPYVILMFLVGGQELIAGTLVERTLFSARYYLLLLGCGFLYFAIAEGVWGAGFGKWLKGLQVVRSNRRRPGILRALIRILIPIACVECVRMPLMMALIPGTQWTGLQTVIYVMVTVVCGWIPVLLVLKASRDNGFATAWDLASGTRVIVRQKGTVRQAIESLPQPRDAAPNAQWIGPYQVVSELVSEKWIAGIDPVLRRPVWLLKRDSSEVSIARQHVARPGRLRWLQKVESGDATWDAFEAPGGRPFRSLIDDSRGFTWSNLRYWLDDLASELWADSKDTTLPAQLSLDHVWISSGGRAIVLDEPWPSATSQAEGVSVEDIEGQQRFLHLIAASAESTSVPLHARPLLKNLESGKFEKLSFLTGSLRGILDRPADVSHGIRAGSIFMLPAYIWIAFVVGRYNDKPWDEPLQIIVFSTLVVLASVALFQLLCLPFRVTASQAIFRLAVINAKGELAKVPRLAIRWSIIWLPLLLPISCLALLMDEFGSFASMVAAGLIVVWLGAAIYAVIHSNRGLHDRLADTWVVRR